AQIYNNICCFSDSALAATAPPQAGGMGVDGGYIGPSPCTFNNCIVANNLAVDYLGHSTWGLGNPTTTHPAAFINCVVANNLCLNSGGINLVNNNTTASAGNVLLSVAQGSTNFVRYVAFGGTNNNFHLLPGANLVIGLGMNLSG